MASSPFRPRRTLLTAGLPVLVLTGAAWIAASPLAGQDPAIDMVWVPPGPAVLGSMTHYPDERPVVERWVDGFWIDRFEVSNARFATFVKATDYVTEAERPHGDLPAGSMVFLPPTEGGPGWHFAPGANWRQPEGPGSSIEGLGDHPVVQVTLADARRYAAWAGREVPTEAQWEYAARDSSRWAHGENDGPPTTADGKPAANTWQGFFPLENQLLDGYAGRAPIGSFPPNERGLFDLIGNVWEWTRSAYRPTHLDSPKDQRDDGEAEAAVIKGGSYLCSPVACRRYRAAARHAQDLEMATNHLGFRTVLEVSVFGSRSP